MNWQPIQTAPVGREMIVAKAFDVSAGFSDGRLYTSDPWCVWQYSLGEFARWPHLFPPTHWLRLPRDLDAPVPLPILDPSLLEVGK